MPKPKIADVMFQQMLESGPQDVAAMGELAASLGLTTARVPAAVVTQRLRDDERFCELPDGRWTTLLAVLEGRWFTHRIRADEVIAGALTDELDLGIMFAAARAGIVSKGGEPMWARNHYLAAAGSWLPDVRAGDIIGMTVAGGAVDVVALPEFAGISQAGKRVADAVRSSMRVNSRSYMYCLAADATRALKEALVADPLLLSAPVPPLSELVPEAADRPTREWFSTEGPRCDIRIEEGCGCYRCHCRTIARVHLELEGDEVEDLARLLYTGDDSLPQFFYDSVRTAMHTALSSERHESGATVVPLRRQ
ncbi:MAG: hypothetical protein ABIM89_19150 [Mycobacteriales bacterium]